VSSERARLADDDSSNPSQQVFYCTTTFTQTFTVYTAKQFPGMAKTSELSTSFSDQGLRIWVRKEARRESSHAPVSDHGIALTSQARRRSERAVPRTRTRRSRRSHRRNGRGVACRPHTSTEHRPLLDISCQQARHIRLATLIHLIRLTQPAFTSRPHQSTLLTPTHRRRDTHTVIACHPRLRRMERTMDSMRTDNRISLPDQTTRRMGRTSDPFPPSLRLPLAHMDIRPTMRRMDRAPRRIGPTTQVMARLLLHLMSQGRAVSRQGMKRRVSLILSIRLDLVPRRHTLRATAAATPMRTTRTDTGTMALPPRRLLVVPRLERRSPGLPSRQVTGLHIIASRRHLPEGRTLPRCRTATMPRLGRAVNRSQRRDTMSPLVPVRAAPIHLPCRRCCLCLRLPLPERTCGLISVQVLRTGKNSPVPRLAAPDPLTHRLWPITASIADRTVSLRRLLRPPRPAIRTTTLRHMCRSLRLRPVIQ